MSPRARRLSRDVDFRPFGWSTGRVPGRAVPGGEKPSPAGDSAPDAGRETRLAAIEREAFAKGYEQGERAGAEAAATRAEAMLRRLAQTIEELADLRRTMIRGTEQEMVRLALAIARRIVRREVAVDSTLTLSFARVALDRLGDATAVTIRLHPDDCAAIGCQPAGLGSANVSVTPDAGVPRGGCRVESDFGFVDASLDAQFHEIAQALLACEVQDAGTIEARRDG